MSAPDTGDLCEPGETDNKGSGLENSADFEVIDKIIRKYSGDKKYLISILLDIQDEYNYLPGDALEYVAESLEVPLSRVYSIATFYSAYSLNPRGDYKVTVCLGTACHVRGGAKILDALVDELGVKPGETTEDMMFTLETVACLGACALGPVIVINDEYFGNMNPAKVVSVVKKYKAKGGN